jgi:hypothetical protein
MTPSVRQQIAAARASLRVAPAAGPAPNKYGARKTECRLAHVHDSAHEARDCNELQLRERIGEIDELTFQHQFRFVIGGKPVMMGNGHVAGVKFDFTYREVASGRRIAQDSKGCRVRDWPLRRALFEALFPEFEVRES